MSNNLYIGIVGLPNIGKSTLFNALTDSNVLAANYPFATIEPNTGIVPVPDPRLQKLSKLYTTDKIVPATVTFVDIAGLVKGASQGEGLGNQFLGHIRGTSAIVHVVRTFQDPNVERVNAQADPKQDIEIVNTELVLADLQTIERRLPRLEKEARVNPILQPIARELEEMKRILDSGTPLFSVTRDNAWDKWLEQELQLITLKPMIYVFNVDEQTLSDTTTTQNLTQLVAPNQALCICAKLESELHTLSDSDAQELLISYGVKESALLQLIHATYNALGLQSFLTVGTKEVRAWTIPQGTLAPQAAGVIHSDFERGFIAAQVVSYPDLVVAGSLTAAKSAGKVRTEGKDYAMQPDDVVEFRFNVSK